RDWLADLSNFFVRPIAIFRNYDRAHLRPDLLAGLTVAVVMLPQAIAYALIAELPPQVGLYAAIVAAIIGVLWGSSAHLHTGPTNAASLLVLSSLIPIAAPGSPAYIAAAGLLAVMVGVFRLVMGLARLGMLVNFVSDSVVIGFTAGAGILISVNQLRHLLRLDTPSSPEFYDTLLQTARSASETHLPTIGIGLLTILIIVLTGWKRPRWPGTLIAMVVASAAVALLQLQADGVRVLGELPRSLPPLARLPLFDLRLIRQLSAGALAVSAIGLVEAMSIARSIAAQSGEHVDSNQEFVGQGLANIAAGFLSGYTCSGSFTRSAVNYTAGGKTPLAVVFSGVWVLIAMLLFAPLAAFLPRTALAGVLVVTAYKMIDRKEMRRIWRTSRGDTAIMLATLLATLLLPLEFAVLTGVMVSFARYIAKTSHPSVQSMLPDEKFEHFVHQPERPVCPQLGVLTIEGSLYFGATQHVEEEIRRNLEAHPAQRFLLLRMHRVNHCDISGLHMLETVVKLYRQHGGDVFMVGVRESVWEKMRLSEFNAFLEMDHYLTQERAIEHIFYQVLDPGVCIYRCPVRAWRECQTLPKCEEDSTPPVGTVVPYTAVSHVAPKALWQQLMAPNGDRPLVVDVREPAEYDRGHIPQARLAPMPRILRRQETLPEERPIVLVCRSGRRSSQVAFALQQAGYRHVANLDGGMLAWEEARLPAVID
ncbi:MAG: STAS domain-containing protein, partial [Anaerolineales bacterium]|nr:STAS domain-containing protein [Anaerolineales bacterium]